MDKLEKLVNLSQKNICIILFDETCPLCTSALQFATRLLTKSHHKVMSWSLQSVVQRKLTAKDQFVFISSGNTYYSHMAWVEIFSLSKKWHWVRFLAKSRIFLFLVYIAYSIVSKYRKKIFKKRGCNCEE
jgi:predicted DCC family thiol-disulfide oxidoreductase YuxK